MDEVLRELLQETRHLVSKGSVHYYDNWVIICNTGEWCKALVRVQRYHADWVFTHTPIVKRCPNFSAYVRHHQNQYSNE